MIDNKLNKKRIRIYINKELILKNAKKLYQQKIKNMSMGYIKNTVDFLLLEEKGKRIF
ncbi:type III toxin-antitoxin system ToxN/AbiQ family toxin [Fusobacterium animalis]|uniref:type III toxin-antitoxin system ToxN/AbiQ family toxin n=1 Tax=Fusobacterium animalis TaxID=76859 RepID=UPI000E5C5E69